MSIVKIVVGIGDSGWNAGCIVVDGRRLRSLPFLPWMIIVGGKNQRSLPFLQ